MTHYYKISLESETGRKFAELRERGMEILKKLAPLQKKYDYEDYYTAGDAAYGDVVGMVFPNAKTCGGEPIDLKTKWRKSSIGYDVYIPRAKSGINEEFDACGKVRRHEFDKVMNITDCFHHIGFRFGDSIIGIELNPNKSSGIPNDAVEITASEYTKLS